ncbi:MAG: hypothetical protein H6908_06125 [Hyphomicrobiales bacterium]|nr:hypothetical protein [Hyphomicrobiales bacterium]
MSFDYSTDHSDEFMQEFEELLEDVPGTHSARGEQALWRAVITQALMDAGSDSSKPEMKYDRAQAVAWLAGTTKDFHTVCAYAGLDAVYVREKAREAIRRGCVWRGEQAVRTIQETSRQRREEGESPLFPEPKPLFPREVKSAVILPFKKH